MREARIYRLLGRVTREGGSSASSASCSDDCLNCCVITDLERSQADRMCDESVS